MTEKMRRLLKSDVTSGIVLMFAALLAMCLANSASVQWGYFSFLETPVRLHLGDLAISQDVRWWINDALMSLFFLVIGLGVKRERVSGLLACREQALFPLIAALGGMLVPALIFQVFNHNDEVLRHGWGIPMATDIAFALGVLSLLGARVPPALRVFLMTLAVVDDLGAIIVIALFYTHQLSVIALAVVVVMTGILAVLNFCRVRHTALYLLVGLVLWGAILKSGLHATLAGILVGLFIPLSPDKHGHSPAIALQHWLRPWVNGGVLPLFAFANAGLLLSGVTLSELTSWLPLGIILGLFVGKPAGITLFCWLAVKLRVAKLPEGLSLSIVAATGVLCGIGFTMSFFITALAYTAVPASVMMLAKLGILLGSLISAIVGYLLLRYKLNDQFRQV